MKFSKCASAGIALVMFAAGNAAADTSGPPPIYADTVSGKATVQPGPTPYAGRGPISPETGFAVPKGYKVAWEDGRLNPRRGPNYGR